MVVRLGYFFFCWERREILGVGRCRLTSRAEKKRIKFPERTSGKMLHLCSAQSFFSGVGSGSFACKICLNGEQFWAVKRKEKEGLIWPSVIRTAQWAGGDFFWGGLRWWLERAAVSLPHVSVGGERWGIRRIMKMRFCSYFFARSVGSKVVKHWQILLSEMMGTPRLSAKGRRPINYSGVQKRRETARGDCGGRIDFSPVKPPTRGHCGFSMAICLNFCPPHPSFVSPKTRMEKEKIQEHQLQVH